ncbi:hypothetical protein SAMD00019534_022050 [Acytostelium subglobosum LB1]|uniref:hypothetical protein n=1 Tax=Acytostelium subglobosum LB1 TaxID=1410327 RepID=UPI0006452131|nr:hypothetical protein SAMD00019534_022050 [Acytostelium subglobosum LB1]GAM19030.1 hypothetical protein SAMD00019534_022050 [Acytostelium subglobosum LB1]|eukprot:XP_012756957.1 hypothetical protein SAMD00019534_022050 [Acytostelium subglobosum LB1]
MYKLLILLATLFVTLTIVNADFTGCGNTASKCLRVGQSCNSKDNVNICQPGSWCPSGDNQNCTEMVNLGGVCGGKNQMCQYGLDCYTGNVPTCQWLSYSTLGEPCDSASSCSTSNLQCMDGKCQLPADKKCKSSDDCPFGMWCFNNATDASYQCVNTLALNGDCTDGVTTKCGVGMVCSFVDDTRTTKSCIAVASKSANAPCNTPTTSFSLDGYIPMIECDVSQGLVCAGTINFTCQTPPTPSTDSVNCTSTSCGPLETCNCPTYDSSMGTCGATYNLNGACGSSIKQLADCAQKNKCQFNSGSPSAKNSCLYRNCGNVMCSNKCGQTPLFDTATCGSSQPLYPACRASSSNIIKPSTALGIAVAVALMALLS